LSGTRTEAARVRLVGRALLVCEIALSCTLLLGSTLLVRSFVKLVRQDRGFDTRGILVATVSLPETLTSPAARSWAAHALGEQVLALPGVALSSWSYGTPPGGGVTLSGQWTSDLAGAQQVGMTVDQFFVTPSFFALYGIPILKGRVFQPTDAFADVLVSERLAKTLWAGSDPVGRSFMFNKQQLQVIGLVKDLHFPSLDRTLDVPQLYVLFAGGVGTAMLSLRCGASCPDPLLVRQRLTAALPGVRVSGAQALADVYAGQLARPRAAAAVAFWFAVIALIASATGLFSLLSQSVARRRREFGIRTALGASPSDIRLLVWRDALVITLAGSGIGTIVGLSLARLMSSLLFDVTVADPLSWSIVISVLVLSAASASWRPTRVAVLTGPMLLLREE
jgi:hypothetical protein